MSFIEHLSNCNLIISDDYHYNLVELPRQLIEEGEKDIAYVQTNKEKNEMMFHVLKHYFPDMGMGLNNLKNLTLINSEELCYKFMEQDFCSLKWLILDIVEPDDFYFALILKLLNKFDAKKFDHMPKIIVISRTETVDLLDYNFKVFDKRKQKGIIYEYIDKIYPIKERFLKLEDIVTDLKSKDLSLYESSIIMIKLACHTEENYIYKLLRNSGLDIEIIKSQIMSKETRLTKHKLGKKATVLLMSHPLMIPLPYQNIKLIYDGFMREIQPMIIKYSSKEASLSLGGYLRSKDTLLRMTTQEFYDKGYAYDIRFIPFYNIYKIILNLVDNNLPPRDILKDLIPDDKLDLIIQDLEDMHVIKDNYIMINKDKLINIPLNFRPSYFLYKCLEKQDNIYPYIIIANLINFTNKNLIYTANSSTEDILKEKFQLISFEDPLVVYLEIWIKFTKDLGTVNPPKEKIIQWCKDNNIVFDIFFNIIEGVVKTMDYLGTFNNINPSLLDSSLAVIKSLDLLNYVYKKFLYQIDDREKKIYTNGQDMVVLQNFSNKNEDIEKFISFNRHRYPQKERLDMINFYTILSS